MAQVAVARFQQLPHRESTQLTIKDDVWSSNFTWEAGFIPASTSCPGSWGDWESLSNCCSSDGSNLVEGWRWSLWLRAPLPSRGWPGVLLQQSAPLVTGDRKEQLLVRLSFSGGA